MARQERPVDPSAGPLQSFAYELRKVRTEAGNPTYRTLAKTAGYSPSTLSEAVSGARRPSLDVVLAYVGACGGDVGYWRARWCDLDERLHHAERPAVAPVPAGEPAPGRQHRPLWTNRRLIGALAAVAVVLIVTSALVVARPSTKAVIGAARGGCPHMPASPAFTGRTYASGVNVRQGPSRTDPIISSIPPGCVLGLSGYCLGEKISDLTSGTPDIRWLQLAGGGFVASGLVHGNPPADLGPTRCEDGRPEPTVVVLTVTPDASRPGWLVLHADGIHVQIVGFAAYVAVDPALPEDRRWLQIGFTGTAEPTFDVAWDLSQFSVRPKPTDEFLIAAVACYGGQGATNVADVRLVRADGTSRPAAAGLAAAERVTAERSACLYPKAH